MDVLAADLNVNYWKVVAGALVGECTIGSQKVVLAKPQSFMNLSGGPVKGLLTQYGLIAEEILIIHDDLDIPPGELKLKRGGGHAGHNGLRSISGSVGSEYARLRIGIGRPPGRMQAQSFVLQHMKGQELEEFEVTCAQASPIAQEVVTKGLQPTMNHVNRSPVAPEEEEAQ